MAAGQIVLEKKQSADKGDDRSTYEEFIGQLPAKEGRYAVYDFNYTLKDGGERSKLLFIVWAPDSAPIKQKMLYASSKDALKKKFTGIADEIQGSYCPPTPALLTTPKHSHSCFLRHASCSHNTTTYARAHTL